MKTLAKLCSIPGSSGDESQISNFILQYISKNMSSWKHQPKILSGEGFQDCIILIFGQPRTAVFAHIDTVGYTVGYDKQLIPVGGPRCEKVNLVGMDDKGVIKCQLVPDENGLPHYNYHRTIARGTALTFETNFREEDKFIQCSYLDNRLGVWNALKLAETLENGAIVFSTYEEHGGGSAGFLAEFLYRNYNVSQALISDITWVTKGVKHGLGVAVSMRDRGIPRKLFVDRIVELLKKSKIEFQLEVESSGGSDGTEIQKSSILIDWCFVGAPEDHVHSSNEKVHKADIQSMLSAYRYLMKHL